MENLGLYTDGSVQDCISPVRYQCNAVVLRQAIDMKSLEAYSSIDILKSTQFVMITVLTSNT